MKPMQTSGQMKVVSWNLRHGGTKNKLDAICDQLTIWNPDLIGLSEFRESKTSQAIADRLRDLGLIHQTTTADANERGMNFLMLASRLPMEDQPSSGLLRDSGRWLHVKIKELDVIVLIVPSRSPKKWQFHDEVVAQFKNLQTRSAICFGDTNSGQQSSDEEVPFFNRREGSWFEKIQGAQWVDVWRERNPDQREFTFYSNRENGFRIDQVFTPDHFADNLSNIHYDWGRGGREMKLSDHAAINI